MLYSPAGCGLSCSPSPARRLNRGKNVHGVQEAVLRRKTKIQTESQRRHLPVAALGVFASRCMLDYAPKTGRKDAWLEKVNKLKVPRF